MGDPPSRDWGRIALGALCAAAARLLAYVAEHAPELIAARTCPKCGHRSR